MGMRDSAKCKVNLICIPATPSCMCYQTLIHSALHYAKVDVNLYVAIKLSLLPSKHYTGPVIGKSGITFLNRKLMATNISDKLRIQPNRRLLVFFPYM